jgi:hypothetical protein
MFALLAPIYPDQARIFAHLDAHKAAANRIKSVPPDMIF